MTDSVRAAMDRALGSRWRDNPFSGNAQTALRCLHLDDYRRPEMSYPQPIDDLDGFQRILWSCEVGGEMVGGQVAYVRETDLPLSRAAFAQVEVDRQIVFSLLLARYKSPAREWLKLAIKVDQHRAGRNWGFVRSYLSWRLAEWKKKRGFGSA